MDLFRLVSDCILYCRTVEKQRRRTPGQDGSLTEDTVAGCTEDREVHVNSIHIFLGFLFNVPSLLNCQNNPNDVFIMMFLYIFPKYNNYHEFLGLYIIFPDGWNASPTFLKLSSSLGAIGPCQRHADVAVFGRASRESCDRDRPLKKKVRGWRWRTASGKGCFQDIGMMTS